MGVLVQQITTIGYGSSSQKTNGIKLWHALHGVVGVMHQQSANAFSALAAKMVCYFGLLGNTKLEAKMMESIPLTLTVIAATFGYAFDFTKAGRSKDYAQALLDSFYMVVVSLTTIGYGDLNPSTPAGKLLSMPVMIFGTSLLSQTFSDDDSRASTAEWFRDNKKSFAESCLNNKNYDDQHKQNLKVKQAKRDDLIEEAFKQKDVKERKGGKTMAEYQAADKDLTEKGRNVCRKKEAKEKKMEEIKKEEGKEAKEAAEDEEKKKKDAAAAAKKEKEESVKDSVAKEEPAKEESEKIESNTVKESAPGAPAG